MSFRRVDYGTERPYEVRVQILGHPVLLGYFPLKSQAMLAEEVALKIRKALELPKTAKRKPA
jgi:hypothetical protein